MLRQKLPNIRKKKVVHKFTEQKREIVEDAGVAYKVEYVWIPLIYHVGDTK